jgi:hypothetical protein
MPSDINKVHYFHAEANSLGGFVEQPIKQAVPAQASASLPAVGGHVTTRTGALSFEGVVSCSAAYTRVSGRHLETDGTPTTLVTSVVEGFNLLEVVTADRIVAQISLEHPLDGSRCGSHPESQPAGCWRRDGPDYLAAFSEDWPTASCQTSQER